MSANAAILAAQRAALAKKNTDAARAEAIKNNPKLAAAHKLQMERKANQGGAKSARGKHNGSITARGGAATDRGHGKKKGGDDRDGGDEDAEAEKKAAAEEERKRKKEEEKERKRKARAERMRDEVKELPPDPNPVDAEWTAAMWLGTSLLTDLQVRTRHCLSSV